MSFGHDDIDKASRPRVPNEDLEQLKFALDSEGKVGIRSIPSADSAASSGGCGFTIPDNDELQVTYPDQFTEVGRYYLNNTLVATVTAVYDVQKRLVSLTKVEP